MRSIQKNSFLSLSALCVSSVWILGVAVAQGATLPLETPFKVHPSTASLIVHRVDTSFQKVPVIQRVYRRFETERGLFGPGWCSNLDLSLKGPAGTVLSEAVVSEVDPRKKELPSTLELRDCFRAESSDRLRRVFKRTLEAWVEPGSGSRILLKSDGRWQLTEAPHAIFRQDGRLESFQSSDGLRWYVRRDSKSKIDSVDNLRSKAAKIHRNADGDVVSISESGGATLATYRHSVFLASVKKNGVNESYEYDSDDNILKLTLSESGRDSRVWGFSYRTIERVSSVQHADGCVSQWAYEKPIGESSGLAVASTRARESKNCHATKQTATVRDVASTTVRQNPKPSKVRQVLIRKPGPLGVGIEMAQVTLNSEDLPILFDIVGPDSTGKGQQVTRLEIEREAHSGTVVKISGRKTSISFVQKPRAYDKSQLDLLDDYETWMAAWGSHGTR